LPNEGWTGVLEKAAGSKGNVRVHYDEGSLLEGLKPGGEDAIILDAQAAAEIPTLIREIRRIQERALVVVVTSSRTVDQTVEYLKAGALDVLFKSMDSGKIRLQLDRLFFDRTVEASNDETGHPAGG
jgi:DNA-binding NtrC family response regulator